MNHRESLEKLIAFAEKRGFEVDTRDGNRNGYCKLYYLVKGEKEEYAGCCWRTDEFCFIELDTLEERIAS